MTPTQQAPHGELYAPAHIALIPGTSRVSSGFCSHTMKPTASDRQRTDLHRALVGTGGGRSSGGGSCTSLGMQGLASKLIGAVLGSWARLLNSHLCCSGCRSLFICMQNNVVQLKFYRHFSHIICHQRQSGARPTRMQPLSSQKGE